MKALDLIAYNSANKLNNYQRLKLAYIALLRDQETYTKILDYRYITVQVFKLFNIVDGMINNNSYLKRQNFDTLLERVACFRPSKENLNFESSTMDSLKGKLNPLVFKNPDVASLLFYYVFDFQINAISLSKISKMKEKEAAYHLTTMSQHYGMKSVENFYDLRRDITEDPELKQLEQNFFEHLLRFKMYYGAYLNLLQLFAFALKMDAQESLFTSAHKEILEDFENTSLRQFDFDFYKENEDLYNLKYVYDIAKTMPTFKKYLALLMDSFFYRKKSLLFSTKVKSSDFEILDDPMLRLSI